MRLLTAAVVSLSVLALAPAAALAAPPPNDNYLASIPITPQAENILQADTTEAGTQTDLFNPSRDGQPLGGGDPETTTCNGVSFGKTIWYDFAPPVNYGVQLRATGFATAVAVYEWNPTNSRITRLVGCSSNAAGDDLLLDLEGRKNYTIQVGGVAGAGGALTLRMDAFPDTDGDGQLDALDKCKDVPGIDAAGGCPPSLRGRVSPSVSWAPRERRDPDHAADRRLRPEGGEGDGALRRLRLADGHGQAAGARVAEQAGRPHRAGRLLGRGQDHDAPDGHGPLPLRRDRHLLQVAGGLGRAGQARAALPQRQDGQDRALQVRLATVAAACAALGLAAPAAEAAIAPPPTVLDFEGAAEGELDSAFYEGAGATLAAPPAVSFCGSSEGEARAAAPLQCGFVIPGGHDSQRSLQIVPGGSLVVRFAAKQASVSMWVATQFNQNVTYEAWPGEPGVGDPIRSGPQITNTSPFGSAAVANSPLGRAEIGSVRVYTGGGTMTVDDITFSPVASPDTEILSGPAAVSRATDASFLFVGNQPDIALRLLARRRRVRALPAAVRADRAGRGRAYADGGDARPLRHARPDAGLVELDGRPEPAARGGSGRAGR